MKTVILTFFVFFSLARVSAQYNYSLSYCFDKIDIGHKHSVKWTIDKAATLYMAGNYRFKHFNAGAILIIGKYHLNRPKYVYEQTYTLLGLSISKDFKIKNKLCYNLQLSPYARVFDTEFYSASMIVDSYNLGLRFDADLRYPISKKTSITVGYAIDKDLYRTAIHSDEITNYDRFINMLVHSLKVGLFFKFGD
ncbi:MAG: hypothetical protein IPJ54_08470 [Saprospiraceae bacterium]|nr:hypothetical protein [Saprospiraceae bacterium]